MALLKRLIRAALLLVLTALLPGAGFAAEPTITDALRGFAINHWSLEEGAPSRINAITQSADGMLWIGGVDGLFRFDGVTFEKVGGDRRLIVSDILAARSGDVWVGLARGQGLLVYRHGRLESAGMPNPSREINDMAEDRSGAIWVARGGRGVLSLARLAGGRWQEFGAASGLPEQPVWNLLVARDGTLWVVLERAIYRLPPGCARFQPTGLGVTPRSSLAEDAHGGIWLSDREGTRRVARSGGGKIEQGQRLLHPEPAGGTRSLFDRRGDLWEATWSDGVVRVIDPLQRGPGSKVTRLGMAGGLLSSQTRAVFEDREGNIWIGSELGLNMLRRVPITVAPGIPANSYSTYRLAAAADGTVYAAEAAGVYRIAAGADPVRVMATRSPVEALCAAGADGIWAITHEAAFRITANGRSEFAKPRPFIAQACAQDRDGTVWMPALDDGLMHLRAGRWGSWPGLGPGIGDPANAVILPDGRAAIQFRGTMPAGPTPFVAIDRRFDHVGGIEGLLAGPGMLLISGATGLEAPMQPGRPFLDKARYPWTASLNGLAQGRSGDSWGFGDNGVFQIRTADLLRALERPGTAVAIRQFDFRDGLNSFVQKSGGSQIVVGGDGRVWFATRRNILMIDPEAIMRNSLAPAVMIRSILAGRHRFNAAEGLTLPAGTTRIEADFTATSLSVPQRVTFRYRLLGSDEAWTTVRNVRQGIYADLGPGHYTLEVLAANEDGVWSKEPARLHFSIARAFHQTLWFRTLAALTIGGLLYLIYSLRLRQVSGQIQQRMLARTHERERIARELHDTMIQGVQGLILRFQAVADHFADDPAAQAVLMPALDRAEEMLVEGRERVSGLRRADDRDLVSEVERLMSEQLNSPGVLAPLTVTGKPRRLLPELVDEVLAVLSEALCNAVRHSGASRIEVGLAFGSLSFTAFVRDNGIGISNVVELPGGREGHYGLIGMNERARTMKGRLRIESAAGFGTEITLRVPARFAYLPGDAPIQRKAAAESAAAAPDRKASA
ncbi:sensor histidine kinase [Novosphingobium sediminis]|uniref:sensor histidine kinase n=1 Tax=Novosphingobium sediminis TaxID=707214 RepID=UPI0011BF0F63|nr:sensor histidine kinase [Novosphingobium sediminis]